MSPRVKLHVVWALESLTGVRLMFLKLGWETVSLLVQKPRLEGTEALVFVLREADEGSQGMAAP